MNNRLEGLPSHGCTLPSRTGCSATPPDQSSGLAHLDDDREVTGSPARSARPDFADRLAREVELRWLDPAGLHLPWLRERERGPVGTAAYAVTLDCRGRVVRGFTARAADLAAYGRGAGTCPREGVLPRSIAVGRPAQAAYPTLVRLRDAGIDWSEMFPVWFGPSGRLAQLLGEGMD